MIAHPRGDPRGRGGPRRAARTTRCKNAPHTAAAVTRRRVGPALLARAGGLPGAVGARAQVLARGRPHRQRLRRPQPGLHLPERRGARRVARAASAAQPAAGRSLRSVPPVPAAREARRRVRPLARPARPPRARPAPLALVRWPAARHAGGHAAAARRRARGWSADYFSRCRAAASPTSGITWLVPLVGAYFGWQPGARARRDSRARRPRRLEPGRARRRPRDRLRAREGRATRRRRARSCCGRSSRSLVVGDVALDLARAREAAARLCRRGARASASRDGARDPTGDWGTHYDALPPGFPLLAPLGRLVWTGLLPQATIWVAFTLAVGPAFSALGVYLAARRPR